MTKKALLLLEDGTLFEGLSFGYVGEATGEVCFNTSMSGYQEILTDPSYAEQMICMTYPEIGNYGVNPQDMENEKPFMKAFIVKNYSPIYSNYRATESLGDFLKKFKIPGIYDIDTRKLVRHLRDKGAMRGIVSSVDLDTASLLKKVKASPDMNGLDLATLVTHKEKKTYKAVGDKKFTVAAFDFGMKQNIIDRLNFYGIEVIRVPAQTTFDEIKKLNVDGVFLSNGPGDPAAVTYAIKTIKQIIETDMPLFGICLGHQLLALALGAKTYKLKFGHRGGNHPVMNLKTGKVEITSQNHGFAVDEKTLDKKNVEVTHINLNDKTNEGIAHKTKAIFSVQYHPEAAPGPNDADYLFKNFLELLTKSKSKVTA
jgi:carbamoyl-phosphate synthase small subunit